MAKKNQDFTKHQIATVAAPEHKSGYGCDSQHESTFDKNQKTLLDYNNATSPHRLIPTVPTRLKPSSSCYGYTLHLYENLEEVAASFDAAKSGVGPNEFFIFFALEETHCSNPTC